MDTLMEILEDVQPDVDFESCDTLIDDGMLDSFAILSIVSELEDQFEISVSPADIIPKTLTLHRQSGQWYSACRERHKSGEQVCH